MQLEEVIKKIEPSEKEIEKARAVAKKIIEKLNKENYEAVLVGSVARGTALKPIKDIDIFVFFPSNMPKEMLDKKIKDLGKKVFKKTETHYAEHPYVKGKVKGFYVELVPCYKIKPGQKIKSAVDRTPLHNEYLMERLKEKHKREVLLLKQFLKNINCYGADQKTHGFSGYLCELLILHYGSFEELLKNAARWERKTVIDIEGHGKNTRSFIEPLIVIDPVDPERNVASAVDRTSLSKFIWACRSYLENPSEEQFFGKHEKIDLKKKAQGRKLISISMPYPDVVPEIAWSQLEKMAKMLKEQLRDNEFEVYRSFYWTDEKKESVILMELLSDELSSVVKHKGPEIWDEKNTKAFIEKNPDFWFYRSRVYAWRKRRFVKAEEFIRQLLKEGIVVPSHYQKLAKKAKIRTGKDVLKHKEMMELYFRKG